MQQRELPAVGCGSKVQEGVDSAPTNVALAGVLVGRCGHQGRARVEDTTGPGTKYPRLAHAGARRDPTSYPQFA